MKPFDKDNKKEYHELSNVEAQKNFLIPEELPEGAYGAPVGEDTAVENKSTPWREGQRRYSAYNYEFRSMHEDLPRQYPFSHPPHDDPDRETQEPYEDS